MMATRQRLRVVLIVDWFFYYTAAIANSLVDTCDVLIVSRDQGLEFGAEGSAEEQRLALLDKRIRVHFIRGKRRRGDSLLQILRVASAVWAFHPDVVHTQPHNDWRLLILEWLSRPRLHVLTVHDVTLRPGDDLQMTLQRAVGSALVRRADAVVVHAHALVEPYRQRFKPRSRQRIFVIPHGVLQQPAELRSLPPTPTALFFGRIMRYKGLDVFVRAVELAAERLPSLRGIVAGRGPELERCMGLVSRPELFDFRAGFVPNEALPDLFADTWLVVLPYRDVSQSGVVPLAFANGRGVVATRVGGLSEAVEDGIDGLLVLPDDAKALADALVRGLSDQEAARQMGQAALRTVSSGRLSARVVGASHVALYSGTAEWAGKIRRLP